MKCVRLLRSINTKNSKKGNNKFKLRREIKILLSAKIVFGQHFVADSNKQRDVKKS